MSEDNIEEYVGGRKKELAAFFTPKQLVKKMYGKIEGSLVGKTILDNSAGTGNILMYGLELKVSQGENPEQALSEMYAVELAKESYDRLVKRFSDWAAEHGIPDARAKAIISRNFVNADALTYDYSFGGKSDYIFGGVRL